MFGVFNIYSEPEPNPPHYTKAQIDTTMKYLLRLFHQNGVEGNTLLSILSKRPVSIVCSWRDYCSVSACVCISKSLTSRHFGMLMRFLI